MQKWLKAQKSLAKAGVRFSEGLTEVELNRCEKKFGFTFPQDLADFLRCGLPYENDDNSWPNWRQPSNKEEQQLNWPIESILFDVEKNGFWCESWGLRPKDLKTRMQIGKRNLDQAPSLIPIRGHRYIPDSPGRSGNPVFSAYQSDIIIYGSNLMDYFQNEFAHYFEKPKVEHKIVPRYIDHWTNLVQLNNT